MHKLSEVQVQISSAHSVDALNVAVKHNGNAASVLKVLDDDQETEQKCVSSMKTISFKCSTSETVTFPFYQEEDIVHKLG